MDSDRKFECLSDAEIEELEAITALDKRASVLHFIVMYETVNVLDRVLRRGNYALDTQDEQHRTPLLLAIHNRFAEHALLLIKAGANTELCDAHGNSPLMVAIAEGQYRVAAALCDNGADFNNADDEFQTPLGFALLERHYRRSTCVEHVDVLIAKMVNPIWIGPNTTRSIDDLVDAYTAECLDMHSEEGDAPWPDTSHLTLQFYLDRRIDCTETDTTTLQYQ